MKPPKLPMVAAAFHISVDLPLEEFQNQRQEQTLHNTQPFKTVSSQTISQLTIIDLKSRSTVEAALVLAHPQLTAAFARIRVGCQRVLTHGRLFDVQLKKHRFIRNDVLCGKVKAERMRHFVVVARMLRNEREFNSTAQIGAVQAVGEATRAGDFTHAAFVQ